MKGVIHYLSAMLFILSAMLFISLTCLGQSAAAQQKTLLPADKTTIVRFFFLPVMSYFHQPLLLEVVEKNDPRLNTAPSLEEGRIAYITDEEMQSVIDKLNHLNLLWRHSTQHMLPRRIQTHETTDRFEIKIFSAQGTANSLFDPKNICVNLEALDTALRQPRAIWEMQLFRISYGCQVANFNREKYLDHDDPKLITHN